MRPRFLLARVDLREGRPVAESSSTTSAFLPARLLTLRSDVCRAPSMRRSGSGVPSEKSVFD